VENVLIGTVKITGKVTDLSLKIVDVGTGKEMLIDRKYDLAEALTLGVDKIAEQVANNKKFLGMMLSLSILDLEDISIVEPAPKTK